MLGTGAWGLCVGARTAGLEQRVPCPRPRQSGCSDSRHTVLQLPLPLPWDWPHWTLQSVARTAPELPGFSLTVPSGSVRPWERQEGSTHSARV